MTETEAERLERIQRNLARQGQHVTTEELRLREREEDQPLPTPSRYPGAHDELIKLLEDRKQLGLRRYGSLLQPHNGRDTLLDVQEELIDLMVYLLTFRYEQDHPKPQPIADKCSMCRERPWWRLGQTYYCADHLIEVYGPEAAMR